MIISWILRRGRLSSARRKFSDSTKIGVTTSAVPLASSGNPEAKVETIQGIKEDPNVAEGGKDNGSRDRIVVGPASGAPETLGQRQAYIYQAAKSTMQSGLLHNGRRWRIDFDFNEPRWENPLMGWTSSRDAMQGVALQFDTKEAAINFAERQGWKASVVNEPKAAWKNKSYADNFVYSASKLKFIRSK